MGAGSISTSRAATTLAVVVVALLSLSGSAQAAFPGQNGKIAYNIFTGSPPGPPLGHLWTVNPDGTGATTIAEGSWPSWSPDGLKIAYMAADGIRVANPDGSGSQLAIPGAFYPAWSPDGAKLAYTRRLADGTDELYLANVDGTGETRVTFNTVTDSHPSWSPDGTRIAFDSVRAGRADVFVINTDGSGETRITSVGLNHYPDWSPDGSADRVDVDPGGRQRRHLDDEARRHGPGEGRRRGRSGASGGMGPGRHDARLLAQWGDLDREQRRHGRTRDTPAVHEQRSLMATPPGRLPAPEGRVADAGVTRPGGARMRGSKPDARPAARAPSLRAARAGLREPHCRCR